MLTFSIYDGESVVQVLMLDRFNDKRIVNLPVLQLGG